MVKKLDPLAVFISVLSNLSSELVRRLNYGALLVDDYVDYVYSYIRLLSISMSAH